MLGNHSNCKIKWLLLQWLFHFNTIQNVFLHAEYKCPPFLVCFFNTLFCFFLYSKWFADVEKSKKKQKSTNN